jgi:four helix bundle protein
MTPEELRQRSKDFGIRCVRVYQASPRSSAAQVMGTQLLRAGTSVGANYRAACRARSQPEFIAKLGIVIEEADECSYWLELLCETGVMPTKRLQPLMKEADELTAIFNAARTTSRKRKPAKITNCKSQIANG